MKRRHRKPVGPRAFRATVTPGEALAIDPGGGGMIASAIRGKQPAPGALGFMFDSSGPLAFDPEQIDDGVAVLCVTGPLEHHGGWWWHSYEDLVRELGAALEHADVRACILKIDSPGGVAAGMGEAHKAIRRLTKRTGKAVYAYADEMACSAAYHLASACSEVWTSEAGHVGSVGVILCTVDETARLEKDGVAVRYLVTGERKADLHPGTAVSGSVVDVAQAKVDKLGRQFFRAVAKARGAAPGGAKLATPEAVRALQAGVFVGNDAVAAGLADGIASWDAFVGVVKASIRDSVRSGMTDGSVSRAAASGKRSKAKPAGMTRRSVSEAKMRTKRKTLGAVAADEKKARKARGMIASALALLGIGGPAAKYTKTTTKTTEEEEEDPKSAAPPSSKEEEEEEAAESTQRSSAAEEEEEEEAMDSASDRPPPKSEEEEEEESAATSKEEEEEEEEEGKTAKAFASADRAYRKAAKGVDAYGIRGPGALLKAAEKATGQKGIAAVLGALSAAPKRAKANAKIEADVSRLKASARRDRIDAIVDKAKSDGRAPSKALRASLRELGMQHGSAWLKGHVATLPQVRTDARIPKHDEKGAPIGAPAASDQAKMREQALAGLSAEERKAFEEIERNKGKTRTTGRY